MKPDGNTRTTTLSAFQGQLLLTLPSAVLGGRFLLPSVFVLQYTGSESLAESQKEFEAFLQFERISVFTEEVGQLHPNRVQLLCTFINHRTHQIYRQHNIFNKLKNQITRSPSWRSATSVLAIRRNSSIWSLISTGVLGASIWVAIFLIRTSNALTSLRS